MYRERCVVLENKKVAPDHFVIRMRSPRISREAKPGQFVQILCEDSYDPLLPRPFSYLTATSSNFSVLYHAIGKGTKILAQKKKGDVLWVLGPLGNGFSVDSRRDTVDKTASTDYCLPSAVVLVGGGVGIPPLYHLSQELLRRKKVSKKDVHVFLGARDKSLLLCERDFRKLGVNLEVTTDDGSKGKKGFITLVLEDFLMQKDPQDVQIYACGPTPMLRALSMISRKYQAPCEVSVEVPMACGFGACIGCAIKIKTVDSRQHTVGRSTDYCLPSTGYRYAIACTEGPVFKADEILWD